MKEHLWNAFHVLVIIWSITGAGLFGLWLLATALNYFHKRSRPLRIDASDTLREVCSPRVTKAWLKALRK